MCEAFDTFRDANPARVNMIAAAIATVIEDGLEVTAERVASNLPSDFSLHPHSDFLSEIAATENGVPTADMDTKEDGDGALDAGEAERPDQLRALAVELDHRASDLRGKIYTLRNQLMTARGALADAISCFVSGHGPKISQQDNIRAELAASVAARAANAIDANTAPIPVAGPSVLDRSAMWSGHQGSSNGDGVDYLRKQMRTGFRRGGTVAAHKGAATRLRVPQE
jgi:hypothetical protein